VGNGVQRICLRKGPVYNVKILDLGPNHPYLHRETLQDFCNNHASNGSLASSITFGHSELFCGLCTGPSLEHALDGLKLRPTSCFSPSVLLPRHRFKSPTGVTARQLVVLISRQVSVHSTR
jgi:hypothetical protein